MTYRNKTFSTSREWHVNAVAWANTFSFCAYFNSNQIKFPQGAFRNLIAVGNESLPFTGINDFETLNHYIGQGEWLIGHLSYDLKNQIEALHSEHSSAIPFPLIHFFKPEHLIEIHSDKSVTVCSKTLDPDLVFEVINKRSPENSLHTRFKHFDAITTEDEYYQIINKLRNHIIKGDIYEINFCIEFIIERLELNPVAYYNSLIKHAPSPFSTFYKCNDCYALCASPERFLKKTNDQLISQPMKGTAPRGMDKTEDSQFKKALSVDEKELAENMMIVDLVRNDLAKSSISGSIKVDEMFGVYTFQHWHQMISTVSSTSRRHIPTSEILKNAFPMGSMTGAPKIKVMQLIERYENFRRGLYSGAIGYFTPDGDFDFNVVIRSLLYDSRNKKGAFMAGGAITYDSIPEKEYKECLIKVKPIIDTLRNLSKTK